MIYIVCLFLFIHVLNGHADLFHCDFEIPCADFDFDENWSETIGLNSPFIDHDHTLNNSSGIYLFLTAQSPILTLLKTSDWIQPSFDQSICFRMWYYTSAIDLSLDIQLVQGDDESLTRTIVSIAGNIDLNNDWIPIDFRLPLEKVKIIIQVNMRDGSLAFDDLSVHFCNESELIEQEILFSCDGESSCIDEFISLPNYPYQWSIIQAYDAIQQENQTPLIDYTFANQSGHYAWLENSHNTEQGNVGYLETKRTFHITKEISYCLNFYYYAYGEPHMSNLKIYARLSETPNVVQQLWPKQSFEEYETWGIVDLPLGSYSLLFHVDSKSTDLSSFALDDISVTSCNYPFSEMTSSPSLLSFSCNFDQSMQCEMENGYLGVINSFNFTIFTGDTIPDRQLGPKNDYTTNSSSGGFYYWNRQSNLSADDFATFSSLKTIERNADMCIKFAYFVKPLVVDGNETILTLDGLKCSRENVWTKSVVDSQGWQLISIHLENYVCAEQFYFSVFVETAKKVAVAFDDIRFAQCSLINTTDLILSTISITMTVTTSSVVTQNSSSWLTFSIELMLLFFILFLIGIIFN
ncbi:hypothetical protein I4U23_020143 [Adineta vaga]|nr:hypothetical protein I4U23_020143 [Adineta vaga]